MSAEKHPCPECGGCGVISGTGMEHDPSCDGSCRNCPVPVEIQEPCYMCGGEGDIPVLTEEILEGKC